MIRVFSFAFLALCFSTPAFANVIWRGDFSNGTTSQWTSREVAAADRVQVVTSPVPPGQQYAMQATVKYGDSVYGGARAELDYETDRPQEGSERYYRWQTYFPTDFKTADYWQLFTQWHQYIDGGSPPLAFMAWGEKIQLGNDQDVYFWNAPLVRGVWHEFVFHVIWSSDPSKGRIELWYDGQKVLNSTAVRTLFAGDTVYLKQGLYRKSLINWTQVVYTAGTVIGTTLADVSSTTTPTASATVSPNPVAFGSVRLGTSVSPKVVTVKNAGTASLTVSSYSIGGAAFTVSPSSTSTTIAAGQSASWNVSFNPTVAGAATGTLTFNTSVGSLPTSLTGTAVFPKTSVSPTSLAFGSVAVGTASAAQSVTVSNTGTDTLTISRLALSGTNAADFSFVSPASLSVAAGQTASIKVTFRPTVFTGETATLTFTTDNGAQSVALAGVGIVSDTTAPAPVTAFSAAPGSGQVGLSWSNPATDYAATRILQSTSAFAADPGASTGQTVVFDGAGTAATASGLVGGTKYFFTAFARDGAGNYSTPVTVNATPTVAMNVSFSDTFNTCTSTSNIGTNWTISGKWYCSSQKSRGEVAMGTAVAKTAVMSDADVSLRVQLTGVATGSGPIARASGGSYYAAVINQAGNLKIVRVVGGTSTVLGTVATPIAAEPTTYTVRLHVTGSAIVQLDAFLNGTAILSAQDSSAARLLSGQAGMLSGTTARTQFDDFSVVSR